VHARCKQPPVLTASLPYLVGAARHEFAKACHVFMCIVSRCYTLSNTSPFLLSCQCAFALLRNFKMPVSHMVSVSKHFHWHRVYNHATRYLQLFAHLHREIDSCRWHRCSLRLLYGQCMCHSKHNSSKRLHRTRCLRSNTRSGLLRPPALSMQQRRRGAICIQRYSLWAAENRIQHQPVRLLLC
jgi:hypothetical protein